MHQYQYLDMSKGRDAREIARRARENQCAGGPAETKSYTVYRHSRSLVSSISPTARNMLDIGEGTELKQFVDTDAGAVILVPEEDSDD